MVIFERRVKMEIMADILKATKKRPLRRTQISQKANVDYSEVVKFYLPFFTEGGFLVEEEGTYKTNNRGRQLLRAFKNLEDFLKA